MKRVLGILLMVAILGFMGFIVYIDITEHGTAELIHYITHILVCVMFCTLFHNPAHRFMQWIKSLLGFKPDDHDCH